MLLQQSCIPNIVTYKSIYFSLQWVCKLAGPSLCKPEVWIFKTSSDIFFQDFSSLKGQWLLGGCYLKWPFIYRSIRIISKVIAFNWHSNLSALIPHQIDSHDEAQINEWEVYALHLPIARPHGRRDWRMENNLPHMVYFI